VTADNKSQVARELLLKENVVSFVDDMDASFPARFARAMRDVSLLGEVSKVTDKDRVKWLMKSGYVPVRMVELIRFLLVNAGDSTASHIFDFSLPNGYAPAYWRQPEVSSDGRCIERASQNGLVFVRNGDRQRIDDVMVK